MIDPVAAFEWGTILSPRPGHHVEVLPVVLEEAFCLWAYPVAAKYFHAVLSVEVFVGFP